MNDPIIANIISVASLLFTIWIQRKKDRKENQKKHDENVIRLEHLDTCVDGLKRQVSQMHDMVLTLLTASKK